MTTDYAALQEKAIDRALAQHKRGLFKTGECLMRVRMLFGIDSKWPTAAEAWRKAENRHPVKTDADIKAIPRGVAVYWTGGEDGDGHIALSDGLGVCETTDFVNSGGFGTAHITDIAKRWTLLHLVGWAPEINGVTIWEDPKRKPPTPAPAPDPKKVPQGTHYTEFVTGVRKLWHDHGKYVQKNYKARRKACEGAIDSVNAGPAIEKVKK
jgi:hypothetical protein